MVVASRVVDDFDTNITFYIVFPVNEYKPVLKRSRIVLDPLYERSAVPADSAELALK